MTNTKGTLIFSLKIHDLHSLFPLDTKIVKVNYESIVTLKIASNSFHATDLVHDNPLVVNVITDLH